MSTLKQDLETLRQLKLDKKETKRIAEVSSRTHDAFEQKVLERMADEEIDSMKTGGVNYVPNKTITATIQDRALFVDWAIENAPELVELHERKGEVNELVRQLLDDREEFPPGLGMFVKEYVSQTAS